MNLFDQSRPELIVSHRPDPALTAAERSKWKLAESERRLAFGIMRADVFTSVLLNTRPLLSPEEIQLTLPRHDDVWHNVRRLQFQHLLTTQMMEEQSICRQPFSDVVRIALDRKEILPELPPIGYELLLFGLQESVWRFTHDTNLFRRLAGSVQSRAGQSCDDDHDLGTQDTSYDDHLGLPPRQMDEFCSDLDRLRHGLKTWKQGFDRARLSIHFNPCRDTVMSCLLLFHLSMLRLSAPLKDLHQVSYATFERCAQDRPTIDRVQEWSATTSAVNALHHARNIWSMVELETQRRVEARARFNFLAFCSLHHAVAVLWAISELRPTTFALANEQRQSFDMNDPGIDVPERVFAECAHLFNRLSPLGGSSFGHAALRLSKCRFPK